MFVSHLRNFRARLLQLLFQRGPLAFFGPDAALRRFLSLAESRRLRRQLVSQVVQLLRLEKKKTSANRQSKK